MNLRLSLQIVSMELRKAFAYRSDFWLSFIVSTLAQFTVAWFLWASIFSHRKTGTIGGYSFASLMVYYLLVPIIGRTVYSGNFGDIAGEIYQGTLTRYLVYPVSFFRYKLLVHCANAALLLIQLLLVITAIALFFPSPDGAYHFTPVHLLQGIVTIGASTVFYFIFSAWIQLIAFWADQVWSLSAILRFITSLLGGSLIPLALFPASLQPVLALLPFSCFVHLPLQCFLGKMPLAEWLRGLTVMAAWAIVCGAVYAVIWRRGNRQYSGVGM